jgi:hypothetical protein
MYLKIDLQSISNIENVKIWPRQDCCQNRNDGIEVRIGNVPDNAWSNNKCVTRLSWSDGDTDARTLACIGTGRYIFLTWASDAGEDGYVNVPELEVYGSRSRPQVVVQFHAIACADDPGGGGVSCAVGSYANSANECQTCPGGKTTSAPGALSSAACVCPTVDDPSVAPIVPPDVRDGLIAQYKFDDLGGGEGVLDSSGNGKTLTAYNVQYENLAYKATSAVQEYFEVDNTNIGYFSPQKLTISFWIKTTTSSFGTIASCRQADPQAGWILYHDSGNVLEVWTGNTAQSKWDTTEKSSAFTGTWQHFTITIDGSTNSNNLDIFKDKVSLGKSSVTYNTVTGNNMRIGTGDNDNPITTDWNPLSTGTLLDEFRLYDRILSQSEINTVYEHSSHLLPNAIAPALIDPSVQSKFLTFDQLGTTTLQFPNATTGEVLVVSGTEFAHAQSIDLAAGAYTVTVGAGESRVVGASGVVVAGSAGGTAFVGNANYEELAYDGVPPADKWSASGIEGSCDATKNNWGTGSATNGPNEVACLLQSNGEWWIQLDLTSEKYVSGIITQGRNREFTTTPPSYHYITNYTVQVSTDQSSWSEIQCQNTDSNGWCYGNTDHTTQVTNYFKRAVTARYVRLFVEDYNKFPALRMSVVTTSGINQDITGTPTAYATPQVILRYNTTFCPASVDSPPFTPTGNVTFLLAKGNVTTTDITDTLQSAITTAIATALDITEPDRVSIDTVKPSPRREKEVNMVVHVEHDDTDRNSIASKTADVATAVKTTLNGNNLNVCGCNAASLVNSEIHMSINC